MKTNEITAAACVAALGWSTGASATNGDQMLGVTATQWGMAGAVVAAPQDAGTVLTNPAGLGMLEFSGFRADMGFGLLNPPRKANGVESDSDLYLIPSGALAFRVSDRTTVGLGMAGLSGMGTDFADVSPAAGNQNVVTTKQFYKIAPGFAFKPNDQLSLGAALNINYQSLAMDMGAAGRHLPQNQVYGFGVTLGAIWRPTERLRVGAAYVSRQEMDDFEWNATDGHYRLDMDGPQQFALGVAFQPSQDLLLEADMKWIGFSEVLDTLPLERGSGPAIPLTFGWDDQVVYAVALQKFLNEKTAIRVGYNYGASPIGPEDVASNLGSLAVTEHHLSLGLTHQLGEQVFASLSYVHAFNNEVKSNTLPLTIELEQNIVNFQISYRN